jgi:hypothetical protein
VFANYLLEKAAEYEDSDEDSEDRPPSLKPFREWLSDRREISNILSRKSLE